MAQLSRSRQITETTRLGLFSEAAGLLAVDIAKAAAEPADHPVELALLDRQLADLHHRLAASRRPIVAGAEDAKASAP